MANHGYISSKKNLKKKQVLQDLQEINQKRFKGLLKIEESDHGSWSISYQDPEWKHPMGFDIWISSPRKLEHRHGHSWEFYLEVIFSNELATKYGGKLSDECCSGTWKPDNKKYPTYLSYLESYYKHLAKKNISLVKELIADDMQYAPAKFRDL